jgi:hypothetical protein
MLNPLKYQFETTLKKQGIDIKINNQNAKVIMKSVDNEYDDKEIFTDFDVKQGMYVYYNNQWFMVTSQVNDKRQQVFNKARIRRCDHTINFIIDDKLYGFPVVFTTSEMAMKDGQLWITRGDFLKIQIPATNISKKIQLNEGVYKFDSKWEIWGKNESRKDIIELSLWWTQKSHLDDPINEIANRWIEQGTEKIDRLDGNITPIMPFEIPEDVLGDAIVTLYVVDKETEENIDITIELVDSQNNILSLVANEPHIINKGTYTYTIEEEGYTIKTDTIIIERDTTEIILLSPIDDEEPTDPTDPEGNITYSLTIETPYESDNPDVLYYEETYNYIVTKLVDGVEVEGSFAFELSSEEYATITGTTNNSCEVTAKMFFMTQSVTLTITDIETDEVAIEKEITLQGR